MRARLSFGIVVALIGLALVFLPEHVAAVLARPYETAGERINMRASWGGTMIGIGLLVGGLPALKPYKRLLLGALMWGSVGIAFARTVGFVLDGSPDSLQWVWLIAEVVIAVGCAVALRRLPEGAAA